jgi:hypothetical protein
MCLHQTALALLHGLHTKPLLPFLLTPLLTTIPLPRSLPLNSLKWVHIFTAITFLSIFREAEKVAVVRAMRAWRKYHDLKDDAIVGEVVVRGETLATRERPPKVFEDSDSETEDEEEECLICSGVGVDDPMTQSISSLSSAIVDSSSSLGPLEAFCTTAPTKHVAHRECFLKWHAAYLQQRRQVTPELVELRYDSPDANQPSDATDRYSRRAKAILKAAGFAYLIGLLRLPSDSGTLTPSSTSLPSLPALLRSYSGRSASPTHVPSVFTLHGEPQSQSQSPPSPSSSRTKPNLELIKRSIRLATLRTSSPSCPGCRSAVDLHFHSVPPKSSDLKISNVSTLRKTLMSWKRDWEQLVTGRTIALRLATEYSFLLALMSMIRAKMSAIPVPP